MKIAEALLIFILLQGCTISMNMVHTEGSAEDVIDETQSPTNDVKPEITVPISPVGHYEC